MFKKLFFTLSAIVFASSTSFGQILIDNAPTPTTLVSNTLIGSGVSVSNISFQGSTNQIGYFDEGTSNIGIPFGVVMSSGNVTDIAINGGNASTDLGGPGDADVLATAQSVTSNPSSGSISSTHDAAVLEFDFVPLGDSVRFSFVFASDEYLTYVNTQFNDAFGFYLSGTNPAGGTYNVENLALVPGTTEPITISTIHPGLNSQYYIGSPVGHAFNGFTVPIDIEFAVVCGDTYHFKFAIADCQDGILDTGVFLEGGSFSSEAVEVAVATVSGDTAVYEGCTNADFIFSRPDWQISDTLVINYDITGTATDGVDWTSMINPVTFLPGEDTVILNFDPTADGIAELPEFITLTAYTISACGDTLESSGTVWIFDEPNIQIDESDTTVFCKDDSVLVTAYTSGGFGPYSYTWSNGSPDADSAYVAASVQGPQEYYVTATDQCGYTETDTITVIMDQTLTIEGLESIPAAACTPTGAVFNNPAPSGITGVPYYQWNGPNDPNLFVIDATAAQNLPTGWYYFTVTDNVCSVTDSVFVDQTDSPVANMTANPTFGCAPLNVVFMNTSENSTNYTWDFGNGNVVTTATMDNQSADFVLTTNVMLIASDDNGCADTTYQMITVEPCGCTDPNAINYNPLALNDDGSCIYPEPVVTAPNVFTPNDDNENDLFELNHKYAERIELVILNRWGNVMYENDGPNPVWDGKSQGGADATEGTYFYKYTAYGVEGTTITGHGFFELIRD